MKRIIIALVFSVFATLCFGQQYNFSTYSIENGLAQSQVYAIYEDSRGYIWVGTDGGGLSVFDGISFTNLTIENGLSSNQIRSIFEDSKGYMWFGTKDGYLNKYDGVQFQTFGKDQGLKSSTIWSINEDLSGNILVGTERDGLYRLKDKKFKKVLLTSRDSLSITVNTIFITSDGILWIGTKNNGLFVYDNPGFDNITSENGLCDNRINSIKEDARGNIWIGTQNGLSMYNGDNFFTYNEKNGLCGNQVSSISVDKSGNIWFGTHSSGVSKFDGKHFLTFNRQNGMGSNNILSITCDRTNNVWFGTDGGGICKFEGERFKHLTERDGLSGNMVMSIYQDRDSNMWFGTYGNGANCFDGKSFKYYTTDNGLCSNLIYDIEQDSRGCLWLASKGGGVSCISGNKISNFNRTNGLPSNLVYSCIEDRHGNMWFATLGGGVSIYDGKTFTNIGKEQGLSSDYVYSLFEDREGNIWLGTDDEGIAMIFADCSSTEIIKNKKLADNNIINFTKFGLTNKMVLSIVQDKHDNIWIGTFGGGITRFDGVDLKNISVKHGLNSNNIYLMLVDHEGYLWAGTEKGLNRVDIRENSDTPEIKTYGKPEGFIGIETNFNAAIEDYYGNLWFGNLEGATMYSPEDDMLNTNEPLLSITGVSLFFSKTDWSAYTDSLTSWGGIPVNLELPYDHNHLTFEFVGIDFKSPKKVTYQWILEGFDKKWSPRSDKREVTYQFIPPGEYTFKIKAFNNDGLGTEKPFEFSFVIPPPFWQTWWFYSLIGIFVLFIIFVFVRLRLRALENEKKLLEEKVEQRTRELQREKAIVEQQTEELRAQTDQLALVNQELEKLSIVARETDNSVMIADADGNIEWVNAGFTKLFGYNFDEFINEFGISMQEASSYPDIKSLLKKCVQTKESVVYASTTKHKNGSNIWVQTTLTPIFDEDGYLKQYVAIDSDITKIKLQEEEIKKRTQEIIVHRDQLKEALNKLSDLEQFKESMIGMIVHDLKNHLNSIITFSSQMVSEQNLKRIHQAGKQMLNMVLNILDVQKFEKTEVKLDTNIHNIQVVVKNALADVSLLISEKSITITNRISRIVQAEFDYEIILRVVVNILSNAIKYTPTNGTITIDAKLSESKAAGKEMISLSIQDTGQGIPEDMLERIFDKFSQVDAKKSGVARSTGLGLSFCKMVVEAHHGAIWAESELGKGTTFFFTLPVVKAETEEDEIDVIEVSDDQKDLLLLSQSDREILSPIAELLLKSDIYEYSQNLQIIEQLKAMENTSEMCVKWADKAENAIYNFNDRLLSDLLAMIKKA